MWSSPFLSNYNEEDYIYAWIAYENNFVFGEYPLDPDEETWIYFDASTGQQVMELLVDEDWPVEITDELIFLRRGDSTNEKAFLTVRDINTNETLWETMVIESYYGKSKPIFREGNLYYLITKSASHTDYRSKSKLLVFDAYNGEVQWEFNQEFAHGQINYYLANGLIFIGTEDGYLYGMDEKTGKELWKIETVGYPQEYILIDNTLLVSAEQNYFYAVDIEQGKQKWMFYQDIYSDSPGTTEPDLLVNNGIVFLSTEDVKIHAIEINSGEVLWTWEHKYDWWFNPFNFRSPFSIRSKVYHLVGVEQNTLFVTSRGELFAVTIN